MKQLTLLVTILSISFLFSCNGETDENQADDRSEKNAEVTEQESPQPDKTEVKKVIVNEPTVVNINDIKEGVEFFGLTVSEAKIPNNKEFTFTIAEEFILDGNVSYGEFDITFMANDPTRSNAVLQIDDMEKPFFMWTTFNNNEAFMAALSDDQKEKVNSMEGLPLKVRLKNYKVSASAEHMMIAASADFVEVIE